MLGPGNIEGTFERADCPLCRSAERRVVIAGCEDRLLGHPGRFDICECDRCGVRFLDPRPLGQTLVGYYGDNGDRTYSDNQPHRPKEWPEAVRWVLHLDRGYPTPAGGRPAESDLTAARRRLERDNERWRLLPWRGSGRLLDVGCGSGTYLAAMRTLGWSPQGNNLVPEVCTEIRARLGIECHAGDLLELELPPASFDAISLWHVLEHLPDPPATLRRIRELLAPGGLVAIGVPVFDSPEAERLGDAWFGYDVPRHLLTFSRERLCSFLTENGFRVERLASEPRDRILKLSYARSDAPWWWKAIMANGRLRRAYARRLAETDRIGTVVVWATPVG